MSNQLKSSDIFDNIDDIIDIGKQAKKLSIRAINKNIKLNF